MIRQELFRGDSLVHRVDPRIKISIALLFSIISALSTNRPAIIAYLFAAIALVLLSRPRFKSLVLRLGLVNLFFLFIWFIIPFSYPGDTVFQIGPWSASRQGLNRALTITLKGNAIILANIALLASNTIFQLSHALRHLGAPDKLVHLFFLVDRYGYVLADEYRRMNIALRSRGFRPRTDRFTYRVYAYIVANLLLKGHERAEQVHRAMICRGFTGKYWILEHFSLTSRDIAFAAALIGIIFVPLIILWTKLL